MTVEYNRKGLVQIHFDQEGLDLLVERLQLLKKPGDHDHLKTPSWAGSELTEDRQGTESELINHLQIMLWP